MAQNLYTMDTDTGKITPVLNQNELRDWDSSFVMGTYGRLPVTFVKGEGVKLWDVDGKEYLDFLSGLAVNGVGHCHPRVVRAIQDQAATLMHVSNLYLTAPQAALAKKLIEISDFDKVFFGNSGAEANEAAIKIARKHGKKSGTGKFEIVTAYRSFHGRTLATITATAQEKYQAPFTPLVPGFKYVEYNDIDALKAAVNESTCAVMLEPVQGEGGVFPATDEYLKAVRAICDQYGALLIFDEVQTGMGRTGHWWAYQHYGVVPDIMTLAKSLGGGVPIGACLARGEAAVTLVPGDHASTFGGNLLAASAALAVIETIENDHLLANAQAMGTYLVRRLSDLPQVKTVRGKGLMLGIELKGNNARQILTDALSKGLIINAIGDTTLRLLPPLIISRSDVDRAVDILASVM